MIAAEKRPLRILHCPWNVGGHPGGLARFERELGAASLSVTLAQDPFGFHVDEVLGDAAKPASQDGLRLKLLLRAIREFDVIHFNFGQTILETALVPELALSWRSLGRENLRVIWRYLSWMTDLPLLRALGKIIVMTYQGDDARQGDYCRAHFEINTVDEAGYYTDETDRWKRRAIGRVARYADRIYALNPDLLHVLPAGSQFLPYAHLDLSEWLPPRHPPNPVPLVVHAPTHRGVKGSRFILGAVEKLRQEKVAFDFVLVESMRYAEARRIYERADLLVDQLLGGWYGGLAVELMALGKPVVCYMRPGDLGFLPEQMRAELPILDASPATITTVLRDLLTRRRSELPEIGGRSRAFVERWHDPREIARRTLEDYRELTSGRRTRAPRSAESGPARGRGKGACAIRFRRAFAIGPRSAKGSERRLHEQA